MNEVQIELSLTEGGNATLKIVEPGKIRSGDVAGFRRVFRKVMGLTPSDYRRRFCVPTSRQNLFERASG